MRVEERTVSEVIQNFRETVTKAAVCEVYTKVAGAVIISQSDFELLLELVGNKNGNIKKGNSKKLTGTGILHIYDKREES